VQGFVGGATRTTADTLKAVFSIVGLGPDTTTLFGFFLIEKHNHNGKNTLVLLADCAVTPDPSPKQLANIAIGAAAAFEYFTGDSARVALLSFSTQGSAEHEMVKKVQDAMRIAKEKAPELVLDGEWQADAALDLATAKIKGVGTSPMAGQANVLIAPDLNCGNVAYKLIQRVGGCRSVGPVLWGTALPANDLSRGCSAEDVVDMLALTTLQTQKTRTLEKSTNAH
jgi:phosphate acetyltransferase